MLHLTSRRDDLGRIAAPSASSLLSGPPVGGGPEIARVYNDVFDAVMDRRLLPGAKLTEAALCDIFQCSRATVRAALSQLAHDRIVVIQPNRGAFVWEPSAKETKDVFGMRRALECMVIDMLLALPDLDDRLAPLYDMVALERKAFECGDRISWIRLSNAFHVELARLLDNDVLTETLHSLCARSTLIIAYYDTPGDKACSYIEHAALLDLLRQGDGAGARAAMAHHLEDCEDRMQDHDAGPVDPWLSFGVKR
ncbi:MAG: GntR family transcriptional regulator [Burkholderiaceae bacterium]|nr:GntR family transcriptional regulator [Burkholderiaceae bacterium]